MGKHSGQNIWFLKVTGAGRSHYLGDSVHFLLGGGPKSQPRGVRHMGRIFDQADEFWLGIVTECVLDNYGRELPARELVMAEKETSQDLCSCSL